MSDDSTPRPGRGRHRAGASELEEPWRSLRAAYRALRARWGAILSGFELSVSEFETLGLCIRGPARATELARATGLTPAGTTDVIDRLERRRFVRRATDPGDRRAVLVRLTPAGARQHRAARSALRDVLSEVDRSLTPSERTALARGLAALVRALPAEAS